MITETTPICLHFGTVHARFDAVIIFRKMRSPQFSASCQFCSESFVASIFITFLFSFSTLNQLTLQLHFPRPLIHLLLIFYGFNISVLFSRCSISSVFEFLGQIFSFLETCVTRDAIRKRNLPFAQTLRSFESHPTSAAAKILVCLNSILLRRKAWLPDAGTVTSISRREWRSSIDFVPLTLLYAETKHRAAK